MTRKFAMKTSCLGAFGVLLFGNIAFASPDPALSVAMNTPNNGNGTLLGQVSFSEALAADVRAGRLSQEQADSLLSRQEAINEKLASSTSEMIKKLKSQSKTSADALGNATSKITGELKNWNETNIQDTADGIVEGVQEMANLDAQSFDAMIPFLTAYVEEINSIVAERAEMISSNPNVSKETKGLVNIEANKLTRQVSVTISTLGRSSEKLHDKVDKINAEAAENKKKIGTSLGELVSSPEWPKVQEWAQKYGNDPKKWPQTPDNPLFTYSARTGKANPYAIAGQSKVTPENSNNPPKDKTPSQNSQQPKSDVKNGKETEVETAQTETSTKPKTTNPKKGEIPNNKPDDAFNVNRNGDVNPPKAQSTPPKQASNPPKTSNPKPQANNQTKKGNSNSKTDDQKQKPPPPKDEITLEDIIEALKRKIELPEKRPPPEKVANGKKGDEDTGAVAGAKSSAEAGKEPDFSEVLNKLKPKNAGRGEGGDSGGEGGGYAEGEGEIDLDDLPDRLTANEINAAGDGVWNRGDSFNIYGGNITQVLQLEEIYKNENVVSNPKSRAPNSLSAAGNSIPLDWKLPSNWDAPEPMGPNGLRVIGENYSLGLNWTSLNLYGDGIPFDANAPINSGRVTDWAANDHSYGRGLFDYSNNSIYDLNPVSKIPQLLISDLMGSKKGKNSYEIDRNFDGSLNNISKGARYVGLLFDDLTFTNSNSINGLDKLLAQPFNVILTWGDGAYDLDLHMTGPTAEGVNDRFHIYYIARGSLTSFPYAELIKDCICSSGSEVILTSALNRGGVYRISVFNYGDQSENSLNLSNLSSAKIQIVRGGVAVPDGNGTTIIGGRVIYVGQVPTGVAGNTWKAIEINPKTGRIFAPKQILNSAGSANVH